MKTKNLWLICILSISLFACGTNLNTVIENSALTLTPAAGLETPIPTFTPWVGGTQTALANPTPIEVDDTSLTPLPTIPFPDVTQEVVETATDFSPVLFGGKLYDTEFFMLLGGVSRDTWLTPQESVDRFSSEATYGLYTLMIQETKYFLWGKSPVFSPTCGQYTVATDAGLNEFGFTAVADGWPVLKREVVEISSENEDYQQVVSDWLAGEGVEDPQITGLQVLRVDIEGDGVDEVFISATHLNDSQHTTKDGDYSIVLMRKVTGDLALTIPVLTDVYHSQDEEITYPHTYSIADFIDLNGDGNLEVVIQMTKWEGFGAAVYQINGQELIQVLMVGC